MLLKIEKVGAIMLVCLLTVLGTQVNAQIPRMVVVEEATQASCPPCATANPPLHALLDQNSTKTLFIAYQVWWPGYDAMFLDNEQGVRDRIEDYYPDVTGAPNIVVQGNSGAQSVSYLTQNEIDNNYANLTPLEIEIAGTINGTPATASMDITGMIVAHNSLTTNDLRLRLVLTEKLIDTQDLIQQGTNGETEFHHVFKKWIGGHAGTMLPNFIAAGDTIWINETFDLTTLNIYDLGQLEIAALVQDDGDGKIIHQAARDSEPAVNVGVSLNAAATEVGTIPTLCPGDTYAPVVEIINSGDNDLTSAVLTYSINGGPDQAYTWTGFLATYQSTEVTLPTFTMTGALTTNQINVTVSDPNGGVDLVGTDNDASGTFIQAIEAQQTVLLEFTTDNYADEIYWEVQDGNGQIVASGGNAAVGLTNIDNGAGTPPADPGSYQNQQTVAESIPVPGLDCFTFYLADFWGDGILAADQSYTLTDNNGTVVASGNFSTALETTKYRGAAPNFGVNAIANLDAIAATCANDAVTPVVTITNFGVDTLTSATISYSLNGGPQQFMNWTGALLSTEDEQVTLPAIVLSGPLPINTLEVEITNPNGTTDEDPADNTATQTFPSAGDASESVLVEFNTGVNGNELYWEIQNSNGQIVASGGNSDVGLTNIGNGGGTPPANAGAYGDNEDVAVSVDITALDCYTFHITDYVGDGISGGDPTYTLTDNNSTVVATGQFSTATETNKYRGVELAAPTLGVNAIAGLDQILPICPSDSIYPVVTITNYGLTTLTSADINYTLNGGALQTMNWTGILPSTQSQQVSLPAMVVSAPMPTNTLLIDIANPNGSLDEAPGDNTASQTFVTAVQAFEAVLLQFSTGTGGNELYWEVQNGSGIKIASGGNAAVGLTNINNGSGIPPSDFGAYSDNTNVAVWVDIPSLDCFTFILTDYIGDGISNASTSFTLSDKLGLSLVQGTFDSDMVTGKYRGGTIGTTVAEVTGRSAFELIGNPIGEQMNVRIEMDAAANASVQMMDARGRVVLSEQLGTLQAGAHMRSFSTNELPAGVYFVSFVTANKVINRKAVVGH